MNPNKVDYKFTLRRLDQMIESGDFVWAEETLMGIHDTIEVKKSATKAQIQAIHNIKRSIQ